MYACRLSGAAAIVKMVGYKLELRVYYYQIKIARFGLGTILFFEAELYYFPNLGKKKRKEEEKKVCLVLTNDNYSVSRLEWNGILGQAV